MPKRSAHGSHCSCVSCGNTRATQRWHMCCKYISKLYLVSCFSSPKTAEYLSLPLCLFHLPTLLKQEIEAQRPPGPQATPHLQNPVPQLQAPWTALLPGVGLGTRSICGPPPTPPAH